MKGRQLEGKRRWIDTQADEQAVEEIARLRKRHAWAIGEIDSRVARRLKRYTVGGIGS